MDKENNRSVFQLGEETVVHPFAKSYSACFGVDPDRRHDSNINFIYFSIRIARLVNTELLTFQRQSKWYHLETDVFHKRQVDLHLPGQRPHQLSQIGLDGHRPVHENAFRLAFANQGMEPLMQFGFHIVFVVARTLFHLLQAVLAECGFVHL